MSVDNLNIHPRYRSALSVARITDVSHLLCFSKLELTKATGLSEKACQGILDAASEVTCPRVPPTVYNIVQTCDVEFQHFRITTGCCILDGLLKGGILYPGLTEICGESSSGKTQFCIDLSLNVQRALRDGGAEGGSLYICTEDAFPNKRLEQMASYFSKKVGNVCVNQKLSKNPTDHIYIEHCIDLDDLWTLLDVRIHTLLTKTRVKLVVIDSIAALFRVEFNLDELPERAKVLSKFGRLLHDLSFKNNIAVVCVNQVSDVFNENYQNREANDGSRTVNPALGLTWSYFINTRLMLSRTKWKMANKPGENGSYISSSEGSVVRSLRVVFSPHLPPSKAYFVVDETGIKGIALNQS